ncbi:hypothetical protein [Trinickia fusca]|uniref:SLATT domain-containing protein n=1 Tax=Trinickia fusca TaxID=2419777 RepID=A0A494X7K0_9BURK|nr:hypothetical protein [Trinickia fusca]RKP43979.1 hypothetical protein D7S89_23890 [Trinickia fusca]
MDWDTEVWGKRYAVLYRCWLSRIYHQKRERFFDVCDNVTKAVAVVGGAASIAEIAAPNQFIVTAAAITVMSALSLVVGYAKKARSHADLAKAFTELEARVVAKGVFDEQQVNAFEAEILRLEMNESRSLGALVRICQNEIAVARGNLQDVRPVSLWRRIWAHLYDFDMSPEPTSR